jgi:aspartate/methionine/tyrosine aminotransferase
MDYKRMPIEIESPEQLGYSNVKYNLTESSVSDALLGDLSVNLGTLKLAYGDHRGKAELRQLLAKDFPGIESDKILITAGAASALFIVATALLEKTDHLIVIHPNYASNIETPRAIGCKTDYVNLRFEDGFTFSAADIAKKIRPNTKLISLTSPHNPTGTVLDRKTLLEIADLAEQNSCFVLLDETYRDLNVHADLPGACLHKRIISVSSVSKAFGLPGLRIGWLVTQDEQLTEKFLAAKEQIFVCNSIIDEEVAYKFLLDKASRFQKISEHIEKNRKVLLSWLRSESRMEMIQPAGGVVCFPRVINGEQKNMKEFYRILNDEHKTFVAPGHWFEMPDHYMRIGFGWPAEQELKTGLQNISLALNNT